jgi:hypothetical protein
MLRRVGINDLTARVCDLISFNAPFTEALLRTFLPPKDGALSAAELHELEAWLGESGYCPALPADWASGVEVEPQAGAWSSKTRLGIG